MMDTHTRACPICARDLSFELDNLVRGPLDRCAMDDDDRIVPYVQEVTALEFACPGCRSHLRYDLEPGSLTDLQKAAEPADEPT
jgi:hypothetical protein